MRDGGGGRYGLMQGVSQAPTDDFSSLGTSKNPVSNNGHFDASTVVGDGYLGNATAIGGGFSIAPPVQSGAACMGGPLCLAPQLPPAFEAPSIVPPLDVSTNAAINVFRVPPVQNQPVSGVATNKVDGRGFGGRRDNQDSSTKMPTLQTESTRGIKHIRSSRWSQGFFGSDAPKDSPRSSSPPPGLGFRSTSPAVGSQPKKSLWQPMLAGNPGSPVSRKPYFPMIRLLPSPRRHNNNVVSPAQSPSSRGEPPRWASPDPFCFSRCSCCVKDLEAAAIQARIDKALASAKGRAVGAEQAAKQEEVVRSTPLKTPAPGAFDDHAGAPATTILPRSSTVDEDHSSLLQHLGTSEPVEHAAPFPPHSAFTSAVSSPVKGQHQQLPPAPAQLPLLNQYFNEGLGVVDYGDAVESPPASTDKGLLLPPTRASASTDTTLAEALVGGSRRSVSTDTSLQNMIQQAQQSAAVQQRAEAQRAAGDITEARVARARDVARGVAEAREAQTNKTAARDVVFAAVRRAAEGVRGGVMLLSAGWHQ